MATPRLKIWGTVLEFCSFRRLLAVGGSKHTKEYATTSLQAHSLTCVILSRYSQTTLMMVRSGLCHGVLFVLTVSSDKQNGSVNGISITRRGILKQLHLPNPRLRSPLYLLLQHVDLTEQSDWSIGHLKCSQMSKTVPVAYAQMKDTSSLKLLFRLARVPRPGVLNWSRIGTQHRKQANFFFQKRPLETHTSSF